LVLAQRPLIERLEPVLRRMTRGKFGVLDLAGLPSIEITCAGHRTGIARTTTVQYVPDGDSMVIVGSNWGRLKHPAWSTNLQAATQAIVRRRGETLTVNARMLAGAERDAMWAKVLRHWPNYEIAQDLAGGRQFRLFLLTPQRSRA
jgi:deazaflavin-dependent oxidoreductase (nitroreductase family)